MNFSLTSDDLSLIALALGHMVECGCMSDQDTINALELLYHITPMGSPKTLQLDESWNQPLKPEDFEL